MTSCAWEFGGLDLAFNATYHGFLQPLHVEIGCLLALLGAGSDELIGVDCNCLMQTERVALRHKEGRLRVGDVIGSDGKRVVAEAMTRGRSRGESKREKCWDATSADGMGEDECDGGGRLDRWMGQGGWVVEVT